MDHILANTDNPVPAADSQGGEAATGDDEDEDEEGLKAHIKKMGGDAGEDLVAKVCLCFGATTHMQSIKCSECGKVFRSNATASFHAERSGHQEFEESTEEVGRGFGLA